MINVAHARAHIEAVAGEALAVPKAQLFELLAEVEKGQVARRALVSVRTTVNVAANQLDQAA